MRLRVATALMAASVLAACSRAPTADPRLVSESMHALYGAIRVERLSPPVASRLMAYVSTALYSGLTSVTPNLPTVSGLLNGLADLPRAPNGRDYDGTFAAVAAERVVLDTLLREGLPTTRAALARLADSLVRARSAAGISEEVRSRSSELGRRIGIAIVAWSRTDGFDSTRGRKYVPPIGPGLWTNDAPANTYTAQNLSAASDFVALDNPANALRAGSASDRGLILNGPKRAGAASLPAVNMAGMSEPYWGEVRPFVLTRRNECPVPEPPPYSTDPHSTLYHAAEQVVASNRSRRLSPKTPALSNLTPEQRAVAFYWADNAGESGTPVGHWISIASQMVSQRQLSAEDAARLMVLTAVAQADAFIAAWGYKYQYNLIRPRPYIRRVIESSWEPLIPTPPFPEYPSAHSTQSAAAAAVLTAFIGDVAFDDSTGLSIGNAVRHFESFHAAADEAGMSRIYGGIHFPYGNIGGRALGQCVGAKVVERLNGARAP